MPQLHELPTIEYPLVFGLVSAGFSLGEINALRLEQVQVDEAGRVRLLGADVSGDLAEVLRCAISRRAADRPDSRLLWTSLVTTRDLRFRTKALTREQQLREFYRVATKNFRKSSTKKGSTPSINKALKRRMSEIVPDIPAAYIESPLSERDLEILGTAMHESGWPAGVVRGVIEPEDDVSRLIDERYIEEVPPNGIVVDQSVLLSQGFASTKDHGLLLERARVEALRANSHNNGSHLGRRSEDLLRIRSALDPSSAQRSQGTELR